ncbi:MAG: helix-turn-helix domain-containing protein [Pseudomonas sp.]
MTEKIHYTESSGNIFADLGLPDADTLLIKAELVRQISICLRNRRLTQSQAADILGIDQPKVSALLRGYLRGFSLERLTRFLNALGRDVDIVVNPSLRRSEGVTRVLTQKTRVPAAAKAGKRPSSRKRTGKRARTSTRRMRR